MAEYINGIKKAGETTYKHIYAKRAECDKNGNDITTTYALIETLGILSNLKTKTKTDLVSAINEVLDSIPDEVDLNNYLRNDTDGIINGELTADAFKIDANNYWNNISFSTDRTAYFKGSFMASGNASFSKGLSVAGGEFESNNGSKLYLTTEIAGLLKLTGTSGTRGIQFGTINYQITNMEAGSVKLSLPKPMGGERPNAQITLKQPNFGNGTWHFYIGILGDEAESVSFAMNSLSSTGFKISLRRQIDISSRTDLPTNVPYTLHWLAV